MDLSVAIHQLFLNTLNIDVTASNKDGSKYKLFTPFSLSRYRHEKLLLLGNYQHTHTHTHELTFTFT